MLPWALRGVSVLEFSFNTSIEVFFKNLRKYSSHPNIPIAISAPAVKMEQGNTTFENDIPVDSTLFDLHLRIQDEFA